MKTAFCCDPPKAEKCRICGKPSPIRFLIKSGSGFLFACPRCSKNEQKASMIESEINRSAWNIAFSDPYQKQDGKHLRNAIAETFKNISQ